ncbi:MAG: DNA polymerase III subunit gamma/tau, partial [Aquaticitalea sp.]
VNIPYMESSVTKMIEKVAEVKNEETLKVEPPIQEPIPIIDLKSDSHHTSGLSLKSIRAKKEHHIRQMEVVINANDLPKEAVTQDDLLNAWKSYVATLDRKGERIMASILEMDTPKLLDSKIHLEFPNQTIKIELERAQFPLMEFLRKTLKNYNLSLEITVNEEIEKQYAYTPMEKYQKLKEKNPNIELLKKTFGLDI